MHISMTEITIFWVQVQSLYGFVELGRCFIRLRYKKRIEVLTSKMSPILL